MTEEAWITFLKSHFNSEDEIKSAALDNKSPLVAQDAAKSTTTTEILFTNKQIVSRISKGKRDGAPGPNGIPPIFLKEDKEFWAEALNPL